MKIQIRYNVFETNSSSTHAVSIFKGTNYSIPENIEIHPGEFGWGYDTFHDPESKLSYLYTWILGKCYTYKYNEVTNKVDSIVDWDKLTEYQRRIKSKLLEAGVKNVTFEKNDGYFENGYIDHSEQLMDTHLETILEKYFLDFVFNKRSYIETGNDNDDVEVCEACDADYSFYK